MRLLTDEALRACLLCKVHAVTETNSFAFPGCQPVSIERKQIARVKGEEPYWVCEKTDGVRYFWCATTIDDTKYLFLLDRAQNVFCLSVKRVPDEVFRGCLIDGELASDNTFHVFDAYQAFGEVVKTKKHSERITHARSVARVVPSLRVKAFYPVSEMRKYVETVVNLYNHKTDGFVFTPENKPLTRGTNYDMFKWKPRKSNTVDFWFDTDHLPYVNNKSEKELARIVVDFPENFEFEPPCVVECEYRGRRRWVPLFVRRDKTHPNNLLTFKKTILNFKENIKIEEFY